MKRKGIGVMSLGVTIFAAVVMSVLFLAPWGQQALEAATSAGVILTNIIRVDWNSGTVNMSTNATNTSAGTVGTNYGMTWIGITNQTVVSGSDISNDTFITNDGNASADFILTFSSNAYANANMYDWTVYFTNVTANTPSSDKLAVQLSQAGIANIRLFVSVPGTESNNAFIIFQCLASNSNAAADIGVNATNYLGYNGISYGGHMGKFGAPAANAFLSNDTTDFTNWTVTALYAGVMVAKTAQISNADPFIANVTDPFPGAIITYRLDYTNKGGAAATVVKMVDTLPTNSLTYVPASIRLGTVADVFNNYASFSNITDDEGDDSGSTNSAAEDQLVFCPTNGTAPGAGGALGPADSGSYFYRTFLK